MFMLLKGSECSIFYTFVQFTRVQRPCNRIGVIKISDEIFSAGYYSIDPFTRPFTFEFTGPGKQRERETG
jgi:hypothetical protein